MAARVAFKGHSISVFKSELESEPLLSQGIQITPQKVEITALRGSYLKGAGKMHFWYHLFDST